MSTTPTRPEMPQAEPPVPSYGTPRWIPILFVILFLFSGYLVYAGIHSRQGLQTQLSQSNSQISQLNTNLDKANSQLDDLKAELDLTTQKLGLTQAQLTQARRTASALRREQLNSSKKLQAQIGQVQQETQASVGQLSTELGGTKTDLAATKQSLSDTQTKLEGAVGDMGVMSGLVAHNKDQLAQLIRMGQRNYYKFDLRKSKYPIRIGPVMVQLRKVDTKHWRYNMYVTVEDKRIEKKDKTLYEPVQFYTSDSVAPMELIVFQMKKNEAIGYLSTPKEQSKQAAAAPSTNK
jgi:multidrug efflux pump subunit AcrA (membrane-fusion protein)